MLGGGLDIPYEYAMAVAGCRLLIFDNYLPLSGPRGATLVDIDRGKYIVKLTRSDKVPSSYASGTMAIRVFGEAEGEECRTHGRIPVSF